MRPRTTPDTTDTGAAHLRHSTEVALLGATTGVAHQPDTPIIGAVLRARTTGAVVRVHGISRPEVLYSDIDPPQGYVNPF